MSANYEPEGQKPVERMIRVYRGPTLRRDKTRGDAERELKQAIESIGGKLISVNWKKKTAHYLDSKGNKKSQSIKISHDSSNTQA